jgi:hypothetical protein
MKHKYSYLLFISLVINRKMTSTNEYTCGICLENLKVSNNFMITQCGHPFHSTCCFSWTFRGNFNCPLCIQPLVDKNSIDEYNRINSRREYNQREYHTIIDDLNNEISVYLYKMIINDLTYFISSDNNSKVFFNIFNNEDIYRIAMFPGKHVNSYHNQHFCYFNFFWAKGNYLITCENPVINDNRYYYETWSGTGSENLNKVYNLYEKNYKKYFIKEASTILHNLNNKL